jgi:hypothetical protein
MKTPKELRGPRNILQSPERRKIIKAGARTAIIAAAMSQFGGLIETAEAAISPEKGGADLIYLNGKVYTSNKKQPWVQAFPGSRRAV